MFRVLHHSRKTTDDQAEIERVEKAVAKLEKQNAAVAEETKGEGDAASDIENDNEAGPGAKEPTHSTSARKSRS